MVKVNLQLGRNRFKPLSSKQQHRCLQHSFERNDCVDVAKKRTQGRPEKMLNLAQLLLQHNAIQRGVLFNKHTQEDYMWTQRFFCWLQ